jgi:hypothetical protein
MEPAQSADRLVQREASVGDVRIEYCAAPRRTGDWFAVGTVIQEGGTPDRATPVVAGLGATELLAVERMLNGLAARRTLRVKA